MHWQYLHSIFWWLQNQSYFSHLYGANHTSGSYTLFAFRCITHRYKAGRGLRKADRIRKKNITVQNRTRNHGTHAWLYRFPIFYFMIFAEGSCFFRRVIDETASLPPTTATTTTTTAANMWLPRLQLVDNTSIFFSNEIAWRIKGNSVLKWEKKAFLFPGANSF